MAVNKDAIGILFGVAGGGAVNSESYNEINRGLNEIVNNINSKDPKFIKLHIDDAEFDKEVEKVKKKVKDIAIGTNIKVASGEAASSLKQIETAAKAATETVEQEAKAQQDAAQKINKKKVAYEAATKALKDYQKALESAASRKGSKQIRVDENGIAYTDSKKMAGAVEKLNDAYRKAQEAMSESALNEMGKRNAAALIKANTALEAELAELMTNFRKTTSEKEAQHAAEIEAANKQQADRLNASQAALDAMRRYRDVLREVVEAESVSFNGKEFLPTNETEQAIQYAERLNVALRESNEAMQSPNLTEGGKKGVMSSYGDEVEALLKRLDPVIQKEKQEAEAVDETTRNRIAANQALKETLLTMRQLLSLKEDLDTINFDGGVFGAEQIGGEKFIEDTRELTVHQQDLLDAIDKVNAAYNRFLTAIRQSGVDMSKFSDSEQLEEMRSLVTSITAELSEASKKAREMYDILYHQDFGVAEALDEKNNGMYVKTHPDNRGLIGCFYSQIKGAKGNQGALDGVFEEIRNQAARIAQSSGEEWADKFFHAVQSRAHVKIPYWKQTLSEATSAGGNEGSGTTERLDNVAETINDIAAKVPEILALAESQGQDVSGVVDTIAEKVQEAKRETEELVNAEKEVKQETQETAVAEEKKARKKKESKKAAEETASAVSKEVKKNEEVVKTEEKKVEKKTRSKKASKEAADAVAEETKKIEEATEETKKAADADEKDNQTKQKKQKTTKKLTEEQRKAIQIMREYFQVALEVESAMTRTNEISGSKEDGFMYEPSDKSQDHYSSLIAKFKAIKQKYDGLSQSQEQYLRNEKLIDQEEMKLSTTMQARQLSAQTRWNKLRDKAQQYYQDMQGVATRSEEASKKLDEINRIANKDDWRNYDLLNQKLEETKGFIDRNNLATEKWYQKMFKTFGTRVRSLLAGLILGKVTQSLYDIYRNVVEIDTALTNLKIVTQENEKAMEKYSKTVAASAKRIGASISDLINSTTTYARLGFSLDDAAKFAELTTMYSKVADVTVDEATKNITALVKAYNVGSDGLEDALDKMMYVGRRYAISSGELGEGLNNAASALNANKNTLEQSLGMLAAANASTQNISKASTGLRTIAARLSAAKTVLEENGDDTEGMAESIVKLEESFKAYGIAVRESNGDIKSTYDILSQIAERWSSLRDDARQAIIGMAAGTRQQDIFTSLVQNWNDAQSVVANINEATGELASATEERLDSIQGKIDQLKAKFEELSTNILSSDLVKLVVDILNGGVGFINWLGQVVDKVVGLNNALILLAATIAVIKYQAILAFLTKLIAPIKALIAWINTFRFNMMLGAEAGMTFGQRVSFAFKQATAAASTFQLAAGAVIIIITALVAVIHSVKQAQEEAIQASISAAEQYVGKAEEAKKVSDSLDDLIEKYKELAEKNDGTWDDESIKQVKSVQDDIVGLVGDQAAGIDLVNGKLSDQYNLLEDVAGKQKEISLSAAQSALADATVAVKDAMSKWRYNTEYDLGFSSFDKLGKPGTYGDIVVKQHAASMLYYDAIQYQFDSVEAFAKQYEAVLAYKEEFAKTFDEHNTWDVAFYSELNKYLTEFKEVYDTYHSAWTLVEELTNPAPKDNKGGGSNTVEDNLLKLKSVAKILEEISGEYDALVDAMQDMDEYGVLTADTFSSMIKDYPDLIKYLTQTENGYILNANALEEYTAALIESYTAEAALATMTAENKEIALQNLKNLQTALAMLSVSSAKVKSDSSARKKALSDEKDALKDQLDAYKQLIDLRKELLQQYEDELKYKRELEKKERKVASLQTQLAVSQLDNTAAGRAKTRQLAKDLKEAQEDLDDYTLEHAIDVVTQELDNQYAEYEKFIDGKLDGIEDAIEALSESNSGSASGVSMQIATAAAAAADKIAAAIEKIETTPVVNVTVSGNDGSSGSALSEAQAYIKSHKMMQGDKARWGQDPAFREIWNKLTPAEQASLTGYTQGKAQYDANGRLTGYELIEPDWMKKVASGGGGGGGLGSRGGCNVVMEIKHGGGIVGDFTRLKSTETFAKLLKGEFVATPAMMERFMNQTLPNLAVSGGGNEFNAPLVSIQCDNVTQESLPKLKQIVNDAVKEIKRQFDDGLTRAGYHKTVNKIV